VADRVLILKNDSAHTIPDHCPTHIRAIEKLTMLYEDERNTFRRESYVHFVPEASVSLAILPRKTCPPRRNFFPSADQSRQVPIPHRQMI